MSNTKHTPGPWFYDENDGRNGYLIRQENTDAKICEMVDDKRLALYAMGANANLIAAAPELLEALQKLHSAAWDKGCSALLESELKEAIWAILKATGK